MRNKLMGMRRRWLSTFSPIAPDLRHSGSLRYDRYATKNAEGRLEYGKLLAMWVADMDFKAPQNVIAELEKRSRQGVFGYPTAMHEDDKAILEYLVNRHRTPRYDRSQLVYLPGLVVALNVCARAFVQPNEAIMMATPVYPPFFLAPSIQGRASARIPLVRRAGEWSFDYDAMRKRIDQSPELPRVKAFFLCNPHNPVGRVFTKTEIREFLAFCAERDILVVSDEIHCDLVLDGAHVSSLGLGYDNNLVVLHAPSKTFNLAGIGAAFAVIPDQQIRNTFKKEARGIVADVSVFGLTAMRSAYAQPESEQWRDGLITYLRGNRDFLGAELAAKVPLVSFNAQRHRGTYLAWLDCSNLMAELNKRSPKSFSSAANFFLETAFMAFNDGAQFWGDDKNNGSNYVRLNFACHRDTLAEAVMRMENAVNKHV